MKALFNERNELRFVERYELRLVPQGGFSQKEVNAGRRNEITAGLWKANEANENRAKV